MTQNTADTIHINLVCEDRQTGKKCQFNDLAIIPLPDGQIRLGDLISSHISLHFFLSNSMIFKHTPEIDIVLGFYPSAELSSLTLPVSISPAGINTLSFKFEKIPTYSSDSEPSQVLNQNQISSNKIINHPNQSLGKQTNINLLPVKSQEAHLSSKISLPQTESKSTSSNSSQEDEYLGSTQERESDRIKEENLNDQENHSNIKYEEYEQMKKSKMNGSDEIKEHQLLEVKEEQMETEKHQGISLEEERASSSCSLNRKRHASEALDCSKSCSPCTSFTENDQQENIQQPSLVKKKQVSTVTSNIDDLSYLPTKPLSNFGVNSSFNVYNPISTTSGIKLGDFSQQQLQTGMTYSQAQQFQQIHQSTSNILHNITCNGTSRQSRNKERTIKEAIEMVTKWRDLQEEYRLKHQVKGLQEVADELNISKKVLDYYFQELRTAEFFGFDFDSNLSSKMGVLRKFIDEQKKNHENKNKNFKITRNLQFRYRLKEDGNNIMNMGSTVSTMSSSSGIENLNINNLHQSKMNLKNSNNSIFSEELNNNNLFSTNMVLSRLLRPSNTINTTADSSSNQGDSPNKKITGMDNINNFIQNQNQVVSPCSSFQEVLSKNSPLFLSFFNAHNSIQSSFTPAIIKPSFNGVSQQQSTQELIQKQLSQQQEQAKQFKSSKQQIQPSQLLITPQTQAVGSCSKGSSLISQNPTNNLNSLPKKSSSSQQLQQTTQQLAGLDKALLLLELINQSTQQSPTPLQNTNSTSTNVQSDNSNANNETNNISNSSNNNNKVLEDVFNLMKLLSSSTEEPGMSTDSQDKKTIPASNVAPTPFLLASKNSNALSSPESFPENNVHILEDILQVKQIQNE